MSQITLAAENVALESVNIPTKALGPDEMLFFFQDHHGLSQLVMTENKSIGCPQSLSQKYSE